MRVLKLTYASRLRSHFFPHVRRNWLPSPEAYNSQVPLTLRLRLWMSRSIHRGETITDIRAPSDDICSTSLPRQMTDSSSLYGEGRQERTRRWQGERWMNFTGARLAFARCKPLLTPASHTRDEPHHPWWRPRAHPNFAPHNDHKSSLEWRPGRIRSRDSCTGGMRCLWFGLRVALHYRPGIFLARNRPFAILQSCRFLPWRMVRVIHWNLCELAHTLRQFDQEWRVSHAPECGRSNGAARCGQLVLALPGWNSTRAHWRLSRVGWSPW